MSGLWMRLVFKKKIDFELNYALIDMNHTNFFLFEN